MAAFKMAAIYFDFKFLLMNVFLIYRPNLHQKSQDHPHSIPTLVQQDLSLRQAQSRYLFITPRISYN